MFGLCDNITNINNVRIVVLNIEIIVQRLKATVREHEPFHNVAQLQSLNSVELRTWDASKQFLSFVNYFRQRNNVAKCSGITPNALKLITQQIVLRLFVSYYNPR